MFGGSVKSSIDSELERFAHDARTRDVLLSHHDMALVAVHAAHAKHDLMFVIVARWDKAHQNVAPGKLASQSGA